MSKNIYKFIFYLLFFTSFESKGQFMFTDDFENGQFGDWENTAQWNISNQSSLSGKYSLQHAVTGIRSSSYINRIIPVSGFNNGLITWNFKLKNGNWIFGATEQFYFFLISDKSDITTSNGYSIGINLTGGDNLLKLCRMEGGKAIEEIVRTDLVWKPGMLLEVEVSHEYGRWNVKYKEGISATWSQEKTGNEKLLNFAFGNIGLYYKFNTAHGGQIWVDDVSMNFENRAPDLHEVRSVGRDQILLLFSEPMQQAALLHADNYKVKTSSGTAVSVMSVRKAAGDTAGVYLQLGNFSQMNLHLTIENLVDLGGMSLSNNEFNFIFIPTAQYGDVVFNELMADPTPVVKLPNAEYIEIKNTSDFPINLKNWILEVNGKQKMLSDKTLERGDYLIFCGTGGTAIFGSYGACLEVSGLLLANEGVNLKLFSDATVLVDSFNYKPAMHRKGYSDGGYSLERIDPLRKCGPDSNWGTTMAENGGTPGMENSLFRDNQDNLSPTISSVIVINPGLLEVSVSEMPDTKLISADLFSYLPSLPVPDSILFDEVLLKYSIYFPKGTLKNGVVYNLVVDGLADECGNKSPVQRQEFWYYIPKQGDLLINEVLFNPFTGGVDFVEIYNHSGKKVELGEVYLGSRDNDQKIKSIYPLSDKSEIMLDMQYAAFTSDSDVLLKNYYSACPECIFEMKKFPAYNLDEGCVILLNKDLEIIDEFYYSESMHHPMLNDVKGISLERNSFSKPSNDPSNWHSAAATVGFATPGYQNSTVDFIPETSDIVTFDPKIFSPNDDGINDRFLIKLTPGQSGLIVNIRIYNESGLEVRRLANNIMVGAQDIIEWDGTTGNHQKAGLGIYIIHVELFGLQSGKRQFKSVCVLTDRLE
ncbi:MAG TPA: lamin tail domain-containing protein [Prolixibacteraceae bacterium]|nr:lamin tail domain-containing protein [Prolixibacteraceae bacterium]